MTTVWHFSPHTISQKSLTVLERGPNGRGRGREGERERRRELMSVRRRKRASEAMKGELKLSSRYLERLYTPSESCSPEWGRGSQTDG